MRRKLIDKNIRKVFKRGSSLGVTIPLELIKELKIRKGQKLTVKKYGQGIIIKDWKK